jgi:hypothetical protein
MVLVLWCCGAVVLVLVLWCCGAVVLWCCGAVVLVLYGYVLLMPFCDLLTCFSMLYYRCRSVIC